MLNRLDDWSTDKIIGAGLILALFLYIIGFYIAILLTGTITPLDVASNIVTGICGYMGRSLLEKNKKDKEEVKN